MENLALFTGFSTSQVVVWDFHPSTASWQWTNSEVAWSSERRCRESGEAQEIFAPGKWGNRGGEGISQPLRATHGNPQKNMIHSKVSAGIWTSYAGFFSDFLLDIHDQTCGPWSKLVMMNFPWLNSHWTLSYFVVLLLQKVVVFMCSDLGSFSCCAEFQSYLLLC